MIKSEVVIRMLLASDIFSQVHLFLKEVESMDVIQGSVTSTVV